MFNIWNMSPTIHTHIWLYFRLHGLWLSLHVANYLNRILTHASIKLTFSSTVYCLWNNRPQVEAPTIVLHSHSRDELLRVSASASPQASYAQPQWLPRVQAASYPVWWEKTVLVSHHMQDWYRHVLNSVSPYWASSTSCLVHGRGCHYDAVGLNIRLRGMLSGASPDIVGADMFKVLPIPMPFKSMQLLHHGEWLWNCCEREIIYELILLVATHFRLLTTTVVAKNPNASL